MSKERIKIATFVFHKASRYEKTGIYNHYFNLYNDVQQQERAGCAHTNQLR